MATVSASTSQATPRRLVDQVNQLKAALGRDGIPVTDMSRAGMLESGIGTTAEAEDHTPSTAPVSIVRLEGPIAPRRIEMAAPGETRFRYFLDGSQQTIPVCRVGLSPVVAALSAAGILERDPSGNPSLRGAAMRVNHSWIAPMATGNHALDRMIAEIVASGGDVRDPFLDRNGDPLQDYRLLAGDYGRALTLSFDLAGKIRAEQELKLVAHWENALTWELPDAWIVIDGRLWDRPDNDSSEARDRSRLYNTSTLIT